MSEDRLDFDFDELERQLKQEIDSVCLNIEELEIHRNEIVASKKVFDSISQVVWEQFIQQIANNAGEDFIKENRDFKLSLSKAEHYLNLEDFVKGKMPTHNFQNADKYNDRFENWKTNFKANDPNNGIKRDAFDKNRATGSASVSKDHTIPIAEILKDPKMTTFVDQKDKIRFANDPNINLKDLDSAANSSKGDKTMTEWLNSERNGKKPETRFNINREELEDRDKYARQKEQELIDNKKAISDQEGRKSVKKEAVKSSKFTTQAIVLALFAKLIRKVFKELYKWLHDKERKAKSFFGSLKKAIMEFLTDFKNNVKLAFEVGTTVILTQIYGSIILLIRKAMLFLKLGGQMAIEVIKYLKDPKNKQKETSMIIMEVGKLITLSLTSMSAIGLGMIITKKLLVTVPNMALSIPMLGSPADLFGIFFGGLTAGICGTIVINQIEDRLKNRMLSENTEKMLVNQEKLLLLQDKQFQFNLEDLENTALNVKQRLKNNMNEAVNKMEIEKNRLNEDKVTENTKKLKSIALLVDELG